jgi:hypothetical protein
VVLLKSSNHPEVVGALADAPNLFGTSKPNFTGLGFFDVAQPMRIAVITPAINSILIPKTRNFAVPALMGQ